MLIFDPFYWFDQKLLFKEIQIFLSLLKNNNFLSIIVLVSEIVTFISKKKVFYEFPQKCFKTAERHSLAVCGSLCGEKQFLLIFFPLTGMIKNSCLNKSKFSTGFSPFQTWLEKKFLSISLLISEIVTCI